MKNFFLAAVGSIVFCSCSYAQQVTAIVQGGGGVSANSTDETASRRPKEGVQGAVSGRGEAIMTFVSSPEKEGVAVSTKIQGNSGGAVQALVGVGSGKTGDKDSAGGFLGVVVGGTTMRPISSALVPLGGVEFSSFRAMGEKRNWNLAVSIGAGLTYIGDKDVVQPRYVESASPVGGVVWTRWSAGYSPFKAVPNLSFGPYFAAECESASKDVIDFRTVVPSVYEKSAGHFEGEAGLQAVGRF